MCKDIYRLYICGHSSFTNIQPCDYALGQFDRISKLDSSSRSAFSARLNNDPHKWPKFCCTKPSTWRLVGLDIDNGDEVYEENLTELQRWGDDVCDECEGVGAKVSLPALLSMEREWHRASWLALAYAFGQPLSQLVREFGVPKTEAIVTRVLSTFQPPEEPAKLVMPYFCDLSILIDALDEKEVEWMPWVLRNLGRIQAMRPHWQEIVQGAVRQRLDVKRERGGNRICLGTDNKEKTEAAVQESPCEGKSKSMITATKVKSDSLEKQV